MTVVGGDPRTILLAAEADARLTWDLAVASVPESAVAERALAEDRSVKDLVAHMADWERWGSDRLRAKSDGRTLPPIDDWHSYEHTFNERSFSRWRDASWDEVRRDAKDAYTEFRALVEAQTEEDLFGDGGNAGMVRACGSTHYAPYLPQVRAYVDRLPPLTRFETARLRLRSLLPSDGAFLYLLLNDPEVMRYIPPSPVPITLERAQRAVDRRIGSERANGFGLWLVERKDTGEAVGQCGLALVENRGPEVEIAYEYAREAWGQGFGTEAAVACLARAFGQLGLPRVIALCYPENIGSWRVMEKAGMRFDGTGTYYGIEMKRYVAEKAWWRQPH